MKFGAKVKEKRLQRGQTQDEFAKALGISKRTLCRYEYGDMHPRNRDVYRKLADYFELDINYFLTEDEEFLTEAAEEYGSRGLSQAESILEQASALFAGGELSEDDEIAFLREMQRLYLDSKERAREKFTPKKYKTQKAPNAKQ